ncbi:TerC family protein, partial [Paenibacillus darwinianus]
LPQIGGLDGGHFLVILAGGIIGLVIMRFAASYFSNLLVRRPGLETAAFMIVGWVGVKLAIYTLSHPEVGVLSKSFPKSVGWKIIFWGVMILIAAGGWFLSKEKNTPATEAA